MYAKVIIKGKILKEVISPPAYIRGSCTHKKGSVISMSPVAFEANETWLEAEIKLLYMGE